MPPKKNGSIWNNELYHYIQNCFADWNRKDDCSVASRLPTLMFTFHDVHGILPFTWPFLAGHYFENFARSSNSFFFFGFYLFFQASYFHSILKVNVESSRNISRLTFCTKWKMLLGTTLDILFWRKDIFIDVCVVIYFLRQLSWISCSQNIVV